MRIDLYTKAVLTVIAVFLAVIALKLIVQPQPVAAEGAFSGVQINFDENGGMEFFDTRTGDIWRYGSYGSSQPVWNHLKLTQLGGPLQKIAQ